MQSLESSVNKEFQKDNDLLNQWQLIKDYAILLLEVQAHYEHLYQH